MKKTIAATLAFLSLLLLIAADTGESELDITKTQLAQTEIQLRQAKAEIQKLRPLAEKAKRLPIQIGKRASILGNGLVFTFENLSFEQLPV